jgi:hypothetical protein
MNSDDRAILEQQDQTIEATGRFTAMGRKVFGPDGTWLGSPRSLRAAAKVARILNDLMAMDDDVGYCIISNRPERLYRDRAHG